MGEKLLIITEKPSAFGNFKTALGGQSGTLDGDEFALVHLYGHILSNGVPDEIALPSYKEKVGKFSNLAGIPWDYRWFDFNKKDIPANAPANYKSSLVRSLNDVKRYLDQGYIPVIASDSDKSGEGDLLVREVLIRLKYTGKTYREYHADETPASIKSALKSRVEVTEQDPTYRAAFTRSNMDYLTQQLTRVATMNLQKRGYRLPAPVPMGRLKSVMVTLVGDQQKAIKDYKPSSVFESRYKLDSLILSRKDMKQFKTKDEWDAEGLPEQSMVRETKQVPGQTIPPKAYTLGQLTGELAKHGMKSKQFLDTYQKMYEYRAPGQEDLGGLMSYPRTPDSVVTPNQFAEMLPLVDNLLDLLGLPKSVFTHRQPRETHVKENVNGEAVSHGAIRPGKLLPQSLDWLDEKFGPHASDIYKIAGERFLMMFLENTEWVRHEYETIDTDKPFTGSVKIITKQGVTDPDENKDDQADTLPDLSQPASLYPHELKSHKPSKPTVAWLMKQLDKSSVGTDATKPNTLSQMSGTGPKFPIHEGKELSLSPIGVIGYEMAKGTEIGSVDGTKKLGDLIESVRQGSDESVLYDTFTNIIAQDVKIIEANAANCNLDELKIEKQTPKVTAEGDWNGQHIVFNRVYMGHEYTDDEVSTLLDGGEIQFPAKSKDGRDVKIKGHLEEQEYKGHKFVGLKAAFVREGYVTREFNGQQVTINGHYMDHQFTEDELNTLFAGGEVAITTHKDGKEYNLTGKLEEQEYQGRKFFGYKAKFPLREGYVEGTWNNQKVAYKGSFMDHKFTDEENQKLQAGESIHITTHKGDKSYEVDGKLEIQEYQGRKFLGFKANFGSNNNDDNMVGGVYKANGKAKSVHFKKAFMGHEFTPEEIDLLLQGGNIKFTGTKKDGSTMDIHGGLAEQSYKGRKFFGFKPEFK